jgi:hypothetical protein
MHELKGFFSDKNVTIFKSDNKGTGLVHRILRLSIFIILSLSLSLWD